MLLQKCVYYCNRKDGMYIEVEAKVGCTLNRRCTLLGPCMVKEDFWGVFIMGWFGGVQLVKVNYIKQVQISRKFSKVNVSD